MLCDGKTSMKVKGLKTGESMSHAQAVEVTRELMARWQREHPNEKWQMAQTDESSRPVPAPPAASGADVSKSSSTVPSTEAGAKLPAKGLQQGDTYASFTDRDYKVWKNETDNFVAEGKKIFHSDKELGGTIGVSCDMCHPGRVEYASRDLSEVPGPAAEGGAAARHDRLVHRESGQRQGARSQRSQNCARSKRTSWPSAKASRSTTASIEQLALGDLLYKASCG